MKHTILIVCLLWLIACDAGDTCQEYGTPFTIEEGRTYCFEDGVSIQIDAIENSYCPCNVQCVWEGEATVEGVRINADMTETAFILHETNNNADPLWGQITVIITDNACEPNIEQISIVVNN